MVHYNNHFKSVNVNNNNNMQKTQGLNHEIIRTVEFSCQFSIKNK